MNDTATRLNQNTIVELLKLNILDRDQVVEQLVEHRLRGMNLRALEHYYRYHEMEEVSGLSDEGLAELVSVDFSEA